MSAAAPSEVYPEYVSMPSTIPPIPATPLTQLAQGLIGTVMALLRIVRWFLHFFSITVPSSIYRVVHYSMTVQVTFSVLALWCVGAATVVVLWLRYWYWNRYESFREEPLRKEPATDLPSDVKPAPLEEDRGSFHSYLDEFLNAIRIFGFLERPVFHELTRHLQTRRMLEGDTLSMDMETSFFTVIDGHVQVFAPAPFTASTGLPDAQPDLQLINDVKSGGTLSSLFTILRLFTEQVQLGFTSEDADVPPLRTEATSAPPSMPGSPPSSTASDAMSSTPSLQTPSSILRQHHASNFASYLRSLPTSDMPNQTGTIARAMSDTTLAVIPADAFRRLTVKYPSAASYIVQVILTRLARVTFHMAHSYLGLTREVMKTEHAINDHAKVFLPESYYQPAALDELWRRYNPTSARPSVADLSRENLPSRPCTQGSTVDMSVPEEAHTSVQPGDLHSMVGTDLEESSLFLDLASHTPRRHVSGDLLTSNSRLETLQFGKEVMKCIVDSIGLSQAIIPELPSTLESPFLTSQRNGLASVCSNFSSLDTSSSTLPDVQESTTETTTTDLEDGTIEIRFFKAGSVLVKAGQPGVGLFYVIDGTLDMHLPDRGPDSYLFSAERGGIAGYLSSLLGVPSYVDIVAKKDTYVGLLPIQVLERLVEKRPNVLLTLSKRLLSLLPPLIQHIDAALDWVHVGAGQILFREGDEGDSLYMVINGRLRAIRKEEGGAMEVLGEYSQGDSVGELEVITSSARSITLHSIRDSELVRMPTTLFNAIALWHPPITIQISRIIAQRMSAEIVERERAKRMALPPHLAATIGRGQNTYNFKTVAILPASNEVPVAEFASELQEAFAATISAPVAFLNQSSVIRALGRHAFTRMGKLKLAGWLADKEQNYRLVLYVVDTSPSMSWATTAIRQADCVLLVGLGDDPHVGEMERTLLSIKTTARKELVLLHPERSVRSGTTREWLKPRPWVTAHHHIEMGSLPRSRTRHVRGSAPVLALRLLKHRLKRRMQHEQHSAVPIARPAHLSDFARLARRLCGVSIGLVLGGGGARGCAHIGVLRALEELDIPIDLVGGTSIGSFVGGLYAREGMSVSSHGRAKRFAGRMASLWRFVTDLTYPLVSYTTGHEFNRGIFKCFADTHIEDMWLPYFTNTTNITWSRMEVHTSGYAWRYIRASMTLAGLVPPMIDDGNMLVDGGYTDNLPVSIMHALGARTVIAIDVSSVDDTSPQYYGDTLSGWWVLLNRLNPWSSMRTIPNIPDIQSRLMYTTSVKMLEDAKADNACLYLRMPVESYGTLDFRKYMEILSVGYDKSIEALTKWQDDGKLPAYYGMKPMKKTEKTKRARRNSL
ncbi:phosphatidylcholine and lysophosphatidylcholine phospholipase [Malassezia pachydermatis]|uniref:Lysophospholipase NTE1 n=1 Tax=Malassezia pachydermatis TaxID=77020 RepID=A0A0M8MVG7_9BASI|nr:patatin-domain-containing protein [Malassezia pachydermatis]KOS14590.1 patatin-domain-containing protein [Malassezia pachydermatis]